MPGSGFENGGGHDSGQIPEHLKVLSLEDHEERKEFFRTCIALYQDVYNVRRQIGFKRWQDAGRNELLDGNFSARMAFAKIKALIKRIEGRRKSDPERFSVSEEEVEQLKHLYEQLDNYHDRVMADAEERYGVQFEEGGEAIATEAPDEGAGGAESAEDAPQLGDLESNDSVRAEFPVLRSQAVEYISRRRDFSDEQAEEIVKKSLDQIDLDAPEAAEHLERILHNIRYQYALPEVDTPTTESSPEKTMDESASESPPPDEAEAVPDELPAEQPDEAVASKSEEKPEISPKTEPSPAERPPEETSTLEQPLPTEAEIEEVRERALEQAAAAERLSIAEPERQELQRLLQKLDWLQSEETTERASDANRPVLYAAVARLHKVAEKLETMVRAKREHGEGFDEQFGELAALRDEMTYLDEAEESAPPREKRKGWWNRSEWGGDAEPEMPLTPEMRAEEGTDDEEIVKEAGEAAVDTEQLARTYESNRKEWHEAAERYRRIKRAHEESLQNHYAHESSKGFFSRVFGDTKRKLGLSPELPEAIEKQREELKKARLAYAEKLNAALEARGEYREENQAFSLEGSEAKAAFARKFIFRPRREMLKLQQEHGLDQEQNDRLQKVMETLHRHKWTIRGGQVLFYGTVGGLTGGAGAALMAGGIKTTRIAASIGGGVAGAAAGQWATAGRVERTQASAAAASEQVTAQFSLQDLDRLEQALTDAEATADRAKRQQKYATIAGAVLGGGVTQAGLDWSGAPDTSQVARPGSAEAPPRPEAPETDGPPPVGAPDAPPDVSTEGRELVQPGAPAAPESGVGEPVPSSPEGAPTPPEAARAESAVPGTVGHGFVRLEDGSYSDMTEHRLRVQEAPEALPEIEHHIERDDTVWDILEHYGSDELAKLSEAEQNQALMAVRAEINASPELQEAAGIRSGDADLIYTNDTLKVTPLLEVLTEKVDELQAASPAPETMTEAPPERPEPPSGAGEQTEQGAQAHSAPPAGEREAAPETAPSPEARPGSDTEAPPSNEGTETGEAESSAGELRQMIGQEGYDNFFERVFGVEYDEGQTGLLEFWVDNPKEYFLGTAEPEAPKLYGIVYEAQDGELTAVDSVVNFLDQGSKLDSVTPFIESLRSVEGYAETVNQLPDHFLLSDLLTALLEEEKVSFDEQRGVFLNAATGEPLLESVATPGPINT